MNFVSKIKVFFNNVGYNKLFLSFMPAFVACFLAYKMFQTKALVGILLIFAILCMHISIQVFDDFMDWVLGQTKKRNELEALGIRGNFNKCIYIYKDKKSPRKYLLISLLLFVIYSFVLLWVCYNNSNYYLLYSIILIILFALLIYTSFGKKVVSYIGNEFFTALLCAPINMFIIFFGITNHITSKLLATSSILFFFIYNICYISSLLNYKPDKMIQKLNLPVIIDNTNFKIYFSLFFGLMPYLLTYISIATGILPKISYITFLMLPFSIWLFYLMYMFENSPQTPIQWHFLMGRDKNKIINEQNNISWYYVRYNFARNIFVAYCLILLFSLGFNKLYL